MGVSESEWETESERAVERELVRRGRVHSYNRQTHNFAVGQSLNGLKLFPSFIWIHLQVERQSVPFTLGLEGNPDHTFF